MVALRPYQADAVASIREAYRAGARRVLFVLPTGGGKTVLFADMAAKAEHRGRRVLALVHRRELVRQIERAFSAAGARHAVARTVQSRNHPAAEFVIVDEAHHATAASYRRALDAYPEAHVLGVTATPARTDGSGLGDVFDAMVEGPDATWLVERGFLARPVVYGPQERIKVQARQRGGDYAAGELAAEVDTRAITGSAIDEYRRHVGDGRAVAFCATVEHAEHVAAQFREACIPALSIDGKMSDAERAPILDGLASGAVRVVTSCELISEGFDLPAVEAAILLRPTASLTVYLQQVGRALRIAPGKDRAVILDHVGNAFLHGLPTEARAWSLDASRERRKKQAGDAPVKRCPSCFALVPAQARNCSFCGHEFEVARIEERPGELAEIKEVRFPHRIEDCATPMDVRRLASARGYKPGWTVRRVMSRFGLDPFEACAAAGYKRGLAHVLGLTR